MKKQIISYKLQNFLAMIPIFGVVVVWLIAWFNIYRTTKNRLYVFLHYLIWLIPMIIVGLAVYVICFYFIRNINDLTIKKILFLIMSYFACLIMALSALGVEKGIIERYNKKQR